VIVLAIGESAEMSGESSSRTDITIPETQRELLRELKKTGNQLFWFYLQVVLWF
jgi:beta-glucosidase